MTKIPVCRANDSMSHGNIFSDMLLVNFYRWIRRFHVIHNLRENGCFFFFLFFFLLVNFYISLWRIDTLRILNYFKRWFIPKWTKLPTLISLFIARLQDCMTLLYTDFWLFCWKKWIFHKRIYYFNWSMYLRKTNCVCTFLIVSVSMGM